MLFTYSASFTAFPFSGAYIILLFPIQIPTSVIGLSGLWLSTVLAILGITSYFNNELIQFKGKVQDRLNKLDKNTEE